MYRSDCGPVAAAGRARIIRMTAARVAVVILFSSVSFLAAHSATQGHLTIQVTDPIGQGNRI